MNNSPFMSPIKTDLLVNRYRIKRLISTGGMGEVFFAEDTLLGELPVAIKFLSQTIFEPKMQDNFAREAQMSAVLSQKSLHIVRAFDYGLSDNGKPFYVMEYLSGQSLKDLIPLSLPMFIILTRQICLGLQCAHQGIDIDGNIYSLVHRDIKPSNILVIPDPILGQLVKILDFGIAKFVNHNIDSGNNKEFNGTLPYSSPEQLEGGKLDSRSDIYSLGIVMFEMLTGQKPWQPETDYFGAWYKAHHFEPPKTLLQANPDLNIPRPLNDLIMSCLSKKPGNRPQNVVKILEVLEDVVKPINLTLPKTPKFPSVHSKFSGSGLTTKTAQACRELIWPEDKPIQEIVFPHLVNTKPDSVTALWLMLPHPEIKNRNNCRQYNHFLFITTPHPMLLWVTVLYSQELGPKWLPCYLDMQNTQNLKLVWLLADNERYPLVFFTLEAPHTCANVLSCSIGLTQRQMLKTWVSQSQKLPLTNQSSASKRLLREQYKKMQPQIIKHLEANSENSLPKVLDK